MWIVLIDPSGTGEWPAKRVFGPFNRHADAERLAFEVNERSGEDVVAKAVEVLDPATAK